MVEVSLLRQRFTQHREEGEEGEEVGFFARRPGSGAVLGGARGRRGRRAGVVGEGEVFEDLLDEVGAEVLGR